MNIYIRKIYNEKDDYIMWYQVLADTVVAGIKPLQELGKFHNYSDACHFKEGVLSGLSLATDIQEGMASIKEQLKQYE